MEAAAKNKKAMVQAPLVGHQLKCVKIFFPDKFRWSVQEQHHYGSHQGEPWDRPSAFSFRHRLCNSIFQNWEKAPDKQAKYLGAQLPRLYHYGRPGGGKMKNEDSSWSAFTVLTVHLSRTRRRWGITLSGTTNSRICPMVNMKWLVKTWRDLKTLIKMKARQQSLLKEVHILNSYFPQLFRDEPLHMPLD